MVVLDNKEELAMNLFDVWEGLKDGTVLDDHGRNFDKPRGQRTGHNHEQKKSSSLGDMLKKSSSGENDLETYRRRTRMRRIWFRSP